MGLYGRNDVMSVAVPLTAGGCGAMHSRPVSDGVAADEWNLESVCVMCSIALRGDPLWAAMPSEIPETPDERMIREDAEKRGERAIKKSQERLSVQQGELNEKIVELLSRGTQTAAMPDPEIVSRLVAEEVQKALAAMNMAAPATATATAPEIQIPVDGGVDLMRLHVRTLGKMCRGRGLDSSGGKADLIARLTAADVAAED
jgi:hypothetical protein